MILHAARWGSGNRDAAAPGAVVLLHGLGDTSDIWRPLMAHWRPPAPVWAFDLPGHGRSPWLEPDAYRVSNLADQVADLFDTHAIGRPLLIGHSLGARICVNLAARSALQVQGCILVDMGAVRNQAVGSAMSDHIDAVSAGSHALDGLIALVLDRLPLADPAAIGLAISAMAACSGGKWRVPLDPAIKHMLAATGDEDIWATLGRLTAPVGIVRGAYSAVLSQADASKFAAAIPQQRVPVYEIEMAGHAIPLEQPARLARAIDACLAAMARAD